MSRHFWLRVGMLGVAAMTSWPLSADADVNRVIVVIVPPARQPSPPPPPASRRSRRCNGRRPLRWVLRQGVDHPQPFATPAATSAR